MNSILQLIPQRTSIAGCLAFLCLLAGLSALPAQESNSTGFLSIRLEQKTGNNSKAVPQTTVFHNGDILRFRLTSRVAGYLYIVDKGTTGETTTLFPVDAGSGGKNRVEADRAIVVPAVGDGWFEVAGPSGFDTIYLLVSATPIVLPPGALPEGPPEHKSPDVPATPPSNLLPRCNDEIFKARGDCVDASAGVAPLPADAPVPRELTPYAKFASRDIILMDDGEGVTVKPAPSAKLPLIYTFRLAHLQ